MSYTFEDFLANKPSETYLSRFQEGGIERGVFSACWEPESFAGLLEFQIFLFRYSALMQPCIHGYGNEELKTGKRVVVTGVRGTSTLIVVKQESPENRHRFQFCLFDKKGALREASLIVFLSKIFPADR